jgi:hypothetical protein
MCARMSMGQLMQLQNLSLLHLQQARTHLPMLGCGTWLLVRLPTANQSRGRNTLSKHY